MKLQRQGQDECQLATIAMLAGRPLAEVRARACREAGVGCWVDTVGRPDLFYRVIDVLCATYGLPPPNRTRRCCDGRRDATPPWCVVCDMLTLLRSIAADRYEPWARQRQARAILRAVEEDH